MTQHASRDIARTVGPSYRNARIATQKQNRVYYNAARCRTIDRKCTAVGTPCHKKDAARDQKIQDL